MGEMRCTISQDRTRDRRASQGQPCQSGRALRTVDTAAVICPATAADWVMAMACEARTSRVSGP